MAAFLASVGVAVNSFMQNVMNLLCMDGAGSDDDEIYEDEEVEELRAKATAVEFAEVLVYFDESMKPGRGHTYFDTPRSPDDVGPASLESMRRILENPRKCLETLRLSPKEFHHLVTFVRPAILQAGARNGGGFRECKVPIDIRLYIILFCLASKMTMRELENYVGVAKSSCNADLLFIGRILVDVLKIQFVSLWPSRAERDAMKQLLSSHLQGTGLFFSLDHTKFQNMDSTDDVTRRQHFTRHKGFGASGLICTNIFGQIIFAENDKNGNAVSIINILTYTVL